MDRLKDNPLWVAVELANVVFGFSIPEEMTSLQTEVKPNLPWAEDHFQERVSGEPLNPPPSSEYWPYAQRGNEEHKDVKGKFSHTYPERMWPSWAGEVYEEMAQSRSLDWEPRTGIRFDYGDLGDLVQLLAHEPLTRQAYLPIWFPEDLTAANKGERVPCTLGYHFLMREGKLNMTYFIRSCDYVRYFRDDVYMACRLVQWVLGEIVEHRLGDSDWWQEVAVPGHLTMHIVSMHCFDGDLPMLRRERDALGRA
jgi:hypothetical protein